MNPVESLCGIDARAKLAFLTVFMVAALHARSAAALGVCLTVAVLLAVAVRLRPRELRAVLVPLVPILLFTILFQVLTLQEGLALVRIVGVAITAEALAESARMVACLLALMLVSVSFMRCTSVEDLMSTLRWLLSPLCKLGLRTDTFILSLSVALSFLPVLVREFQGLKTAQLARLASFDGTICERLRAYVKLFAPLLHSSFNHADNLADAFLARGFSCNPAPTRLQTAHLEASGIVCLLAAAILVVCVVAFG